MVSNQGISLKKTWPLTTVLYVLEKSRQRPQSDDLAPGEHIRGRDIARNYTIVMEGTCGTNLKMLAIYLALISNDSQEHGIPGNKETYA